MLSRLLLNHLHLLLIYFQGVNWSLEMLHYLETSQLELGAVHKGRRKIFGLPSDILQHRNLRPPSPLKYSDVIYGWPSGWLLLRFGLVGLAKCLVASLEAMQRWNKKKAKIVRLPRYFFMLQSQLRIEVRTE